MRSGAIILTGFALLLLQGLDLGSVVPDGEDDVLEEPQLGRHERVHYVRRQVLPDEQQGLNLLKKLSGGEFKAVGRWKKFRRF